MSAPGERLNEEERKALAEPVYDAYRLGKYCAVEYLDMWHQLEIKPTETPEQQAIYAAVESILAAREADLREAIAREIEERARDDYLSPNLSIAAAIARGGAGRGGGV